MDAAWRLHSRPRALFLARLLAGEMPIDIEEAFEAVELSLFPERRGDLRDELQLPRHREPVQARRRGLLPPGRIVRPRSIPGVRVAWPAARPASSRTCGRCALPPRPSSRSIPAPAPAGALEGPPAVPDEVARFWHGSPAWAEVRIEPRPAGSPDALLREMPDELRAALGDGVALLRAVYAAAAREARLRLDPTAADDARPGVSGVAPSVDRRDEPEGPGRRSARSDSRRCSR